MFYTRTKPNPPAHGRAAPTLPGSKRLEEGGLWNWGEWGRGGGLGGGCWTFH